MGFPHERGGSWLMPLQGHSQESVACSWQLQEVPQECREANITAIHKPGMKEDLGNPRPVTLTSFPGKVLEALILKTISRCRKDKEIIGSRQHGFSKCSGFTWQGFGSRGP